MSIVKLKKAAIVCRSEDKPEVLHALQVFGKLHLNALDAGSKPQQGELEEKLSDGLKKALRYLQNSPTKRKQVDWDDNLDAEELIAEILDNQLNKRIKTDEKEKLQEREALLQHWGDFRFSELNALSGQRFWFYMLPFKHLKSLEEVKTPWKIIHKANHRAWLVLISPDEPANDILPVERLHIGALSLSEVQSRIHQAELDLEDLEFERQRLTRYIQVLERLTARIEDKSSLGEASGMSFDAPDLSVVDAWVADKDIASLQALSREQKFALHVEEVTDEDQPPTLLSNAQSIRGGEALVNFYQTPAYRTWDPSLILFASFSLFFAMIMSDAAYSAILFSLVVLSWKKMGNSELGRNMRPLLASVTAASVVWGILVGSYFGKPAPTVWLESLHWLDVNDFDTMMAISIACGVIHIVLANLQQSILWWGHNKSIYHIGWIVVLIAGSLLGLKFDVRVLGINLAYGIAVFGLLLVFIGGGQRKIKKASDLLIRFLEGLKAVSNITNIFGDVLSYLRLFALGLASASLALTFNDLADGAFASESGLGLLFGILILIVGHTLNLFLGIVSGVVHGLRLNFIEFYKWALDGEGKPFKAFKKQEYSQ